MTPRRQVLFLVGLVLVIVLVTLLPEATFRSTQGFLVAASGVILVMLALATFLVPARRALGRLFGFDAQGKGVVAVAKPDEWRDLVKPLFSALVCLAVAGVSGLARTLF